MAGVGDVAPVLAANLIAVVLGICLPLLDETLSDRPKLPIPLSAVEQFLGALAAGMITFTGIVFSAVLVAAQIQTSSYSPRLAARLRREPRDHHGPGAHRRPRRGYSLFALASIGRAGQQAATRTSRPRLPWGVALLLTLLTIGGLRRARAARVRRQAHQIGGILRGLMRRAYHVIEDVHPRPRRRPHHRTLLRPRAGRRSSCATTGRPAVLASVDRAALLTLARQTGGLRRGRAGDRALRRARSSHDPTGSGPSGSPIRGSARRVPVLARQRTMDQDPAFALRMFVDIAIRGLSPAVNDPTTAVQALDRIETLLLELHEPSPGRWVMVDENGTPARQLSGARLGRVRQPGADRGAALRGGLGADRPSPAGALRPPARRRRRVPTGPDRARAAAARRTARGPTSPTRTSARS